MRCVIYGAKSNEDERGSIDGQLEACRDECAARGWEIDSEHRDEAMSGYTKSRGPGLAAALARASQIGAEDGECMLVCLNTDRVARGNAKNAAHLVEYAVLGIKHDFT